MVKPWRLLFKSILLFLTAEALLVYFDVNPGKINIYAPLGLLRERFPFSTQDPFDAVLDVGNLDAMIASHAVSRTKSPDEYRVFLFGDSATWGVRLPVEQTLSSQINQLNLNCGPKKVRAYNLSFPLSSASKDLMILDKTLPHQPDLILWFITWTTLSPQARSNNWLVSQNPLEFYHLASQYGFLPNKFPTPTPLDEFLAKQRALFHTLQYQLYSFIEIATQRDQIQFPPGPGQPPVLSRDLTFGDLKPPQLPIWRVSLDQVQDFVQIAGGTPVLLVNEPIQILTNLPNSDLRYNEYYPRWIYDQYRQYLGQAAAQNHWNYLDLWNAFPAEDFTNTPLHLSADGEHRLAEMLAPAIQGSCP